MKKRSKRVRRKKSQPKSKSKGFFYSVLFVLVCAVLFHFFGDVFTGSAYELADNEIGIKFIDVGQGDAILIYTNENAVLIDGGEFIHRHRVISALRNAGVTKLDFIIATHPHSDHVGGLAAVINSIGTYRVIMPDAVQSTIPFEEFLAAIERNNVPVTIPSPGDRLIAGLIDLTVIAPQSGVVYQNVNNASVVLRLVHGETSFLFTGDAEELSEMEMIASGLDISANVLKVGHHGSRTSTTSAFLDRVNPSAAVISVGSANGFGHPHTDVTDRLISRDITVYRTDQNGTVRMITDGIRILSFVSS